MLSSKRYGEYANDPWLQIYLNSQGTQRGYTAPAFPNIWSGSSVNRFNPDAFTKWKASLGVGGLGNTPPLPTGTPVSNTPLPWDNMLNGVQGPPQIRRAGGVPPTPTGGNLPIPSVMTPAPMNIPPEIATQMQNKGLSLPGINRQGGMQVPSQPRTMAGGK